MVTRTITEKRAGSASSTDSLVSEEAKNDREDSTRDLREPAVPEKTTLGQRSAEPPT
jgi:hypothetical protein